MLLLIYIANQIREALEEGPRRQERSQRTADELNDLTYRGLAKIGSAINKLTKEK